MASRSFKAKRKLKTTLGKAPAADKENSKDDISNLWKPIETSVFGLSHILRLFETATDEVRRLLTYECDLVYECRICRSLYRSLANFILHKREYCCDRYKINPRSKFFRENSEILISCEEDNSEEETVKKRQVDEDNNKVESILPKLAKKPETTLPLSQREDSVNDIRDKVEDEDRDEADEEDEDDDGCKKIKLQKMKTSKAAVFQTVARNLRSMSKDGGMKAEVMEIHSILNEDEAILDRNGKVIEEQPDESSSFVCEVCKQKFLTKKTLSSHVKMKHNDSRLMFPCPACKEVFASSWSVFRHLYKIHRKTAAQVRRLRNQIQAIVFDTDQRKENNQKKPSYTFANEENEWMENFEGDNDLQMCGGCGRRFERKAALHSHSVMCSKRIALCNSLSTNKSVRRNSPVEDSPPETISEKGAQQQQQKEQQQQQQQQQEKQQQQQQQQQQPQQEETVRKETKPISPASFYKTRSMSRRKPNILRRRFPLLIKKPVAVLQKVNDSEPIPAKEKEPSGELEVKKDVDKNEETNEKKPPDDPEVRKEPADMDECTPFLPFSLSSIEKTASSTAEDSNESVVPATAIEVENQDLLQQSEVLKIIGVTVSEVELETVSVSEDIEQQQQAVAEEEEEEEDVEELRALFNDCPDKSDTHTVGSDIHEVNIREIPLVVISDEDSNNSSSLKRKFPSGEHSYSSPNEKRLHSDSGTAKTLDERMSEHANIETLTCNRCRLPFETGEALRGHMAVHFNWYRYKCQLCSFRCYGRVTSFLHVMKMHERNTMKELEGTVIDIPELECVQESYVTPAEIVEVREECEENNDVSKDSVNPSVQEDAQKEEGESGSKKDREVMKMVMEVIFGNGGTGGKSDGSSGSGFEATEASSLLEISSSSAENSASHSPVEISSVSSRPIRRRAPYVRKDFLYDMSSLIKGGGGKAAVKESGRKSAAGKYDKGVEKNVQCPIVPKLRLRKCEEMYVRCEERMD